MSDIEITIPRLGVTLSGWSGLQINRGIDQGADGFAFTVPYSPTPENLRRFDPYRSLRAVIKEGGDKIIEGYMEQLGFRLASEQSTLEIQGRGRAAPVIDMSAGPPFEFDGTMFNSIADTIATGVEGRSGPPGPGQFDVRADPDFAVQSASIEPGQTVYDFLSKLASSHGLYALPQPDGTLLFSRLSSYRAAVATILEGESPLISISTNHDITHRFYLYTAVQSRDGNSRSASVEDPGVDNRIRGGTVVEPEQESAELIDAARFARSQALASSYSATAEVTGWRHDGQLWNPGDIVDVQAPSARIMHLSRLVIKSVTMQLDENGGEVTRLDLALPELYDGSDIRGFPWAP